MKRLTPVLVVATLAVSGCEDPTPGPPEYNSSVGCSFDLSGGMGSVARFSSELDGNWIMTASPISNLVCGGKEIELESTSIVGGFITTKMFGKIKVVSKSSAGRNLTFFMPMDQAEKLTGIPSTLRRPVN